MNRDAERAFWCGVRLERNPDRAKAAWHTLVENAPLATNLTSRSMNFM